MRTRAATALTALVLGAGFYAVTTATDAGLRKASFSCWWAPEARSASLSWTFGAARSGKAVTAGASRNAPFVRKASGLRVGELVSVGATWDGMTSVPGLVRSCTIRAGGNVKEFRELHLRPMLISLEVT